MELLEKLAGSHQHKRKRTGDLMKSTQLKEPRSGITTVTGTASPITKIGNSSTAATTTYTATTVADATAWDLSALTAGQIALGIWAVTTEGYRGRVTAANNTSDTVTIAGGWITPEGNQLDPNIATKTPTNATAVTFHRVSYCKSIIITGYSANTVTVYAGFNSSLPSDGMDGEEISASVSKAYTGNIDATKLYVICASSSPKVSWIASDVVGGIVGGGGSATYSGTVSLTSDVTGVLPIANGGTNANTESGARTSLGLGTIATQSSSSVAITGGTMSGVNPLFALPSSDHTVSGITITATAGVALAIGDACYLDSAGKMQLGDADALATSSAIFLCADVSIAQDATGNFLLMGFLRDDTLNFATVGGWVYLSTNGTTGNTLTQTAPSGADDVIQIIGIAYSADVVFVLPNLAQIEHS